MRLASDHNHRISRVFLDVELMNNQLPWIVTPDQYERARSFIAERRMEFDVAEQKLAEGLKLNEDLEELERNLARQVQEGEEAR